MAVIGTRADAAPTQGQESSTTFYPGALYTMAHVVKSGSTLHLEPMAPPPRPAPLAGRAQPRQTQYGGERGYSEFVPTGLIDGLAGVRQGLERRVTTLAYYVAVAARLHGQRYAPLRGPHGKKTDRKDETGEETSLREAMQDVLDLLGENSGQANKSVLEKQLDRYFEPVQRMKVLVTALQNLEGDGFTAPQKRKLGNALNGMITTLMKKHPHEFRAMLQESDDAGAKMDPLTDELQSSVRLRLLIGAKDAGKFDVPLSALTVLRALIRHFGPDCLLAMCCLRSRMMSVF